MKFKVTNINPFKEEVTQEDFDLEEGKMKTIATMFDDGKSAEEIAKALKLPVATVKGILGEVKEEQLHEFKKMTVTFKSMDDMSKASTDLAKQGFTINAKGTVMKVDGKGADLNKYATDLKNFYKATVRAESYTIDESADEDSYDPITEACWVGYKKVGMKKKGDKMVPNCVPEETIKEEEDDSVKLKNQLDQKDNEIAQLKQKSETDKAKNLQQKAQSNVNPETGEPLLQVGIAYKHLKDKMAKEAEAKKQKENSQKIKDLASDKKGLEESNASDKAKGMGLDYMKFGRYGKDGKVTHKTSGDNLVKVGKDDEPTDDKPAKKPDTPKKDTAKVKEVEDPKVKANKFLKSLEDGKVEDENGVVELDFDDEGSFEAAAEKARSMGLDDLADDIDSVGGRVMEYDIDKAQAEYQDMMSKYSGKPNRALEYSKKADEAISMMSDQTYALDVTPFADDLSGTLSIMKQMVDSDETPGEAGGGNSNPKKGFRPEVIDTLQSVSDIMDHAAQLEDETDNEKVKDILSQMQGELDFIQDESADHDNYTKSHKVNGTIDSMIDLNKQLQKELKKENKGVPAEPKVPNQREMQKDLEGMVTDGIIDVDFDGKEINMSKEYEPSQESEAEKDAQAIRDYLKKKGVKLKKDDVEIEKDEEYIQITVNKNIKETFTQKILEQMKKLKKVDVAPDHDAIEKKEKKESADYLMPKMNTSQLANIKKVWQHKTKKDVTPAVIKMIKNMDIPTQLAIKHAKINQLSKLVEDLDSKDKPTVKDVANQLKKAVKAHGQQAKDLEKAMKTEMAKDKAYAIGMATAKKKFNDEPPLDKKTITKAHEIGDKLSKMKKENKDHPAREIYEQIKGLKNKAEKSGMPYGILKKVYDRGMAAWRGGHRPGTTQQQWAFARVNSFVTKSSGTWGGADKDLAKQVKGS